MSAEARGSIPKPRSQSLSGRAERVATADKKGGRAFLPLFIQSMSGMIST